MISTVGSSDSRRRLGAPPAFATLLVGFLTVGAGVGGFCAWASHAPLASAAVANGVIAVEINRKMVQHAEGGSVAELLVREGDRVHEGQVLLRLDDLETKASHDVLLTQYIALAAQEARLKAERDSLDAPTFPTTLDAGVVWAKATEILDGQQRIFATGRAALEGQTKVLRQRIAQLAAQIDALRSQLASGEEQLLILEEETAAVQSMVDKGLERKPRLLALKRAAALLKGQRGDFAHRIAQAREAIAEAELQILNAVQTRVEKAALELGNVAAHREQIERRLMEAQAKLGRRDVLAPIAGLVFNLKHHSTGAVVRPGGDIMEIVPDDAPLVIEARLSPLDIDVVRPGQSARIVLSAYKTRIVPPLNGTVIHVSADALTDERTGQSYFAARISVDSPQLAELSDVSLAPGMPVEAFVETGSRTMLQYVLQPITDSFRRAFREQ